MNVVNIRGYYTINRRDGCVSEWIRYATLLYSLLLMQFAATDRSRSDDTGCEKISFNSRHCRLSFSTIPLGFSMVPGLFQLTMDKILSSKNGNV